MRGFKPFGGSEGQLVRMEERLLHHGLVGDLAAILASRLLSLFVLDDLGRWVQTLGR